MVEDACSAIIDPEVVDPTPDPEVFAFEDVPVSAASDDPAELVCAAAAATDKPAKKRKETKAAANDLIRNLRPTRSN
jgi:hypothetical protein